MTAIATIGGLGLLGLGLNYLWNRNTPSPEVARLQAAIRNARYANMRNLNPQAILAGGDPIVTGLAALYAANKQRYTPSCVGQFRAVLDEFEVTRRGDWQAALYAAFVARAPTPQLRSLRPGCLAGSTKNLIDALRQLYLTRDFGKFSSTLLATQVADRLNEIKQEFGEALYYFGVGGVEAAKAKQSIAGPVLHHYWPFISNTTRLYGLAVTNPKACVDELFDQMVQNSGYQYDSSIAQSTELHHSNRGNCQALSNDFGFLLSLFGIAATFETVEPAADRQRFIVHCPSFIDPNVAGNIHLRGQLLRGYYMFQSHFALKYGDLIYDVMAGVKYHRLTKVATLVLLKHFEPNATVLVFRQSGNGEIMNGKNRLVADYGNLGPGELPRCELYSGGDYCQALGRRVP